MISHRYLSGLRIDHELQYRVRGSESKSKHARWDALHLQQSPLDRSCGLVSSLMLAMLVEGMPRDHAVSVAWSARPMLRRLWGVAKAGYFQGNSPAALVRQVEVLCEGRRVSQLRGSPSELFTLVAAEAERDNVALLLIGDSPKARLHWVMAIGVEYADQAVSAKGKTRSKAAPIALLGLDPESPPPVCSAFNWRMSCRSGATPRKVDCSSTKGTNEGRKLQRAVVLHRDGTRV
jgi:hypothetical protein